MPEHVISLIRFDVKLMLSQAYIHTYLHTYVRTYVRTHNNAVLHLLARLCYGYVVFPSVVHNDHN